METTIQGLGVQGFRVILRQYWVYIGIMANGNYHFTVSSGIAKPKRVQHRKEQGLLMSPFSGPLGRRIQK